MYINKYIENNTVIISLYIIFNKLIEDKGTVTMVLIVLQILI